MKSRRIAFFGLAVLALFALFYSGESIFLWIVYFQMFMLVITAANLLTTFALIRYNQSVIPVSAVKGDLVTLRLELHNESFLPFAHLTVRYSTPQSMYTGAECSLSASLLPKGKEIFEVQVKCDYRGVYPIGFTFIEATDLFGLITVSIPFSKYYTKPIDLLIYPRVRQIARGFLVNRELEGAQDTQFTRSEELSSIAEIRDYQEGDALKRIHWKLSARHQKYLVKEFDGTLVNDSVVLVDCTEHGLSGVDAARFEDTVAECATAFCKRLTDDYQPIKVLAYSDTRTELAGSSPVDFAALHELMARTRFRGNISIASAIKLEKDSFGNLGSLILVTRAPTDELFEVLLTLAENDCRITLVTVLKDDTPNKELIKMLGEFSLRGIRTFTLLPGEDVSLQLGGIA